MVHHRQSINSQSHHNHHLAKQIRSHIRNSTAKTGGHPTANQYSDFISNTNGTGYDTYLTGSYGQLPATDVYQSGSASDFATAYADWYREQLNDAAIIGAQTSLTNFQRDVLNQNSAVLGGTPASYVSTPYGGYYSPALPGVFGYPA